jgi:hypothetical protein
MTVTAQQHYARRHALLIAALFTFLSCCLAIQGIFLENLRSNDMISTAQCELKIDLKTILDIQILNSFENVDFHTDN